MVYKLNNNIFNIFLCMSCPLDNYTAQGEVMHICGFVDALQPATVLIEESFIQSVNKLLNCCIVR